MRGNVGLRVIAEIILAATLPTVSWASIIEGPIVNPANGDSYYILSQGSWTQDEAAAESIGGHLVTIASPAENQWIVNNLAIDFANSGGPDLSDIPLWIGFYDPDLNDEATHAVDFQWADGSPVTYTNWSPNEPNDDNGNNENYAALNWHLTEGNGTVGTWNDCPIGGTNGYPGNTNGPYYGIAEIIPEPTSLALLASAVLAAVSACRRKRGL